MTERSCGFDSRLRHQSFQQLTCSLQSSLKLHYGVNSVARHILIRFVGKNLCCSNFRLAPSRNYLLWQGKIDGRSATTGHSGTRSVHQQVALMILGLRVRPRSWRYDDFHTTIGHDSRTLTTTSEIRATVDLSKFLIFIAGSFLQDLAIALPK